MSTPQEQEPKEQTEFAANQERSTDYSYTNETGVASGESPPVPTVDREKLRAQMQQQMKDEQPESSSVTPEPASNDPIEVGTTDASPRSINFGVVGWGQGGSRLTEQFYKFGYPSIVGNTALQDLTHIQMPDSTKIYCNIGLGGVGKDLTLGAEAFQEYQDQILQAIRGGFGDNIDALIVCIGGGGGTGSGAAESLIQAVLTIGVPVLCLYTLPMDNEGSDTKSNAIVTLDRIARLAASKALNGLIVIDNSRIEEQYPDISQGQFWNVANFDIVNILHQFNALSATSTKYQSLDPMDFGRVISTGNCIVYGKMTLPVRMQDNHLEMIDDELARAMVAHMDSSLLANDFDLTQAVCAGVMLTGRDELLNQLPAVNVNFAFSELNDRLGGTARVFRGIYADDNPRDELTVYSIYSGIGLPRERIDNLIAEAQAANAQIETREADTTRMSVFAENQTVEKEQGRYSELKKKSTAFGRLQKRPGRSRG